MAGFRGEQDEGLGGWRSPDRSPAPAPQRTSADIVREISQYEGPKWKPLDASDVVRPNRNRQSPAPAPAPVKAGNRQGQAQAAGPGMTNTSSPNPLVNQINASQMLDFQGDLGAKRAAQVAAGQIADSGAQAEKAALGGLRRRGVTGGGLEGNVVSSIAGDTQRAIAGSSANIGLQKEDMRMRLGGQIAGQALNSDAAQNDQRLLALRQYQTASDTRLREEQARRQALEDQISLFSRMSDLGSGGGLYNVDPARSIGGGGGGMIGGRGSGGW